MNFLTPTDVRSMRSVPVFLIHFMFFWVVISVPCSHLNSTSDCLLSPSCGWCPKLDPSESRCLPGTSYGPNNQEECHGWRYVIGKEDACLPFTSCEQCTQQIGCGWCGSVCVTGTAHSPFSNDVNCPEWTWKSDACAEPDCSLFKNCLGCVKQKYPTDQPEVGCGWCDKQTCLLGQSKGANTKNCQIGWFWSTFNCLVTPDCSSYSSCQNCINDESLMCGWCESTRQCIAIQTSDLNGTASLQKREAPSMVKPANGVQCKDWRYGTCSESCYSRSLDCDSCNSQRECGWCTDFCTLGNASGPEFLPRQYCSPWSYNNCDARRCGAQSTCDDCKQKGCHWCSGSCKSSFSLGCCEDCFDCFAPYVPTNAGYFMHVSVGLLVALGGITGSILLASLVYSFWRYYWIRRHYFEVLQ